MPDFAAFWGSRGKAHLAVDEPLRAADVVQMILDQPTSIAFKDGSTAIAAQTVLATQSLGGQRQARGGAGEPGQHSLLLLGVQGHDTLADFDVEVGYRFQKFGTNYIVRQVITHVTGVIEAHCEGQQ
jgi:hypothetical protein